MALRIIMQNAVVEMFLEIYRMNAIIIAIKLIIVQFLRTFANNCSLDIACSFVIGTKLINKDMRFITSPVRSFDRYILIL